MSFMYPVVVSTPLERRASAKLVFGDLYDAQQNSCKSVPNLQDTLEPLSSRQYPVLHPSMLH